MIPVIKVSTKDKRSRVLQLDISLEGPDHSGLQAAEMMKDIMQEFSMCRPLMLVLKKILHDRGLLTAYTGGLSSYGLFLMCTRYLQEQASSWSDCGSLLMGFLDFYGNAFDPRSTGISVRNKQYFSRPHYSPASEQIQQQIWDNSQVNPAVQQRPIKDDGFRDLTRRHSFADKARTVSVGASSVAVSNLSSAMDTPNKKASTQMAMHGGKPPRMMPSRRSYHSFDNEHHAVSEKIQPWQEITPPPPLPLAQPYTFDPLMMEDPLNPANNIGRNTFRIFQVQRAFSDAHRALVGSLEWDMNSITGMDDCDDYPLLKTLLNNEDVFFESESILNLPQH